MTLKKFLFTTNNLISDFSLITLPLLYYIEVVQCIFMVEMGNQTNPFVISNVLFITIISNIFNYNRFVTRSLVYMPVIIKF